MKYIGIDYHTQYFVATTMDDKGKDKPLSMSSSDLIGGSSVFSTLIRKDK